VHFHIIPRRSDDGWRFGWRKGAYAEGEMQKLQARIKGLL
jgi:diadenosine tetraphosphate (Ap4A) HIT family hydrolase